MALQRIGIRLTELRCLAQSEGSGGSEPYLWTTFFAFGAQQAPLQTGLMQVATPSYDAFRTEFPNGIRAGGTALVPVFIASGYFDIDLDTAPHPKLLGAIAVLMEEDSTPETSIVSGRIAYSKEIEHQLNLLADARLRSGNFGSITDAEIKAIKDAVSAKVTKAVASGQSVWNVFRDQDDNLGFMYKTFSYPSDDPAAEIRHQFFDFRDSGPGTSNNFRLSGMIDIGPVQQQPVVPCAAQRAALKAKQDEIAGLQLRVQSLQNQLQHATPQQKGGLIQLITETNAAITDAQARLPTLQAELDACLPHHTRGTTQPGGPGGSVSRG